MENGIHWFAGLVGNMPDHELRSHPSHGRLEQAENFTLQVDKRAGERERPFGGLVVEPPNYSAASR